MYLELPPTGAGCTTVQVVYPDCGPLVVYFISYSPPGAAIRFRLDNIASSAEAAA